MDYYYKIFFINLRNDNIYNKLFYNLINTISAISGHFATGCEVEHKIY